MTRLHSAPGSHGFQSSITFTTHEKGGRSVESLKDLCIRLEAFETPRWAVRELLTVELLTRNVWDPCAGRMVMVEEARAQGYDVMGSDIYDWSQHFKCGAPIIHNFLSDERNVPVDYFLNSQDEFSVLMNPPFSLACGFVDKALKLGARKVVCFQRHAWRESHKRAQWWHDNPPARIWLCGGRASCWRFDVD